MRSGGTDGACAVGGRLGRPFLVLAVVVAALLLGGVGPAAVAAAPPSLTIVAPENFAVVDDPVLLKVAVTGAKIGRPVTGRDHLHVSVDGGPEQAIYSGTELHLKLAPGKHTVSVQLAGPTHEPLLPAQFVTFTVK